MFSRRFKNIVPRSVRRFLLLSGAAFLAFAQQLPSLSAGNVVLHNFAGGTADGRAPWGGMALAGNLFYGTTRYGGTQNNGTIFRMNPDGTGYTILHHFVSSATDGAGPQGELTVEGATLYGTTVNGGATNFGTVFSMKTDGSNFTLLHTFTGGTGDGAIPGSSLVLVGSTLYGVTELGGTANLGTVFKINSDGTNYAILHHFATGTGDGHLPFAGLTLAGSTLFGVTAQGGSVNSGTIFKIDLDGSNFGLLYSFKGPTMADGYNIEHRLTLIGSTLYGVTVQGGTAGTGTVFKINTNGTGYAVLHHFEPTGGGGLAGTPSSALTLVDDHLVGSTDPSDPTFTDLLYSLKLDGTGFGVLYRFNGPTTEGRAPVGTMTSIGSVLYGMTNSGGTGFNSGVVYTLGLPTLRIGSVMRSVDGHFILTGQNFSNSSVTIESSPDLVTAFTYLGTTTADSNGIFQYDDPAGAGATKKFYRAVTP